MSGWDDALWYLRRPQQALFRGAKEGADWFANTSTKLTNAGMSPYAAVPMAAIASYAPAVAGAVKGLVGSGNDVSGAELADGLTGSAQWDRGIGTAMDVTADPLSAIPGAYVNQGIGTAYRTGKNLLRLRNSRPEMYDNIANMGIGNILRNTDLAYAPKAGENLPAIFRAPEDKIGQLAWDLGYTSGRDPSAPRKGMNIGQKLMITNPTDPEANLRHEFFHWAARENSPNIWNQSMGAAREIMQQQAPKYSEIVDRAYSHVPDWLKAEEAIATTLGRAVPDAANSAMRSIQGINPLIADTIRRGVAAIPQAALTAATPLSVPYALSGLPKAAQDLYDSLWR